MRRAVLAALTITAAGCGAASINGNTAEKQIKASNAAYKKVSCPSDISATKGATFTCKASTAKGDYVVTISVDSVDAGGNAHLSFVSATKQKKASH